MEHSETSQSIYNCLRVFYICFFCCCYCCCFISKQNVNNCQNTSNSFQVLGAYLHRFPPSYRNWSDSVHDKYSFNKKRSKSKLRDEIIRRFARLYLRKLDWPISCRLAQKPRKEDFRKPSKSKNVPRGSMPLDPLQLGLRRLFRKSVNFYPRSALTSFF